MGTQLRVDTDYLLLKSDDAVVSEKEAKHYVDLIKSQTESRPLFIFDFTDVQDIALPALRILTRALSATSQSDAKIVIIARERMRKLIKEQGLDRIFPSYGNISDVLGHVPAAASKQQTLEFLNTTLDAINYTLQVSANTQVVAGKPVSPGAGTTPQVDIGAAVGLISTPFNGSLILAFPMTTYLPLMSRMLGTDYREFSMEIRDGAAELLNMILGQAKTTLNEKGYGIKQAIPTVVQGTDIRIFAGTTAPSVIIPFNSDIGTFYAELATNFQKKN